MDFAYTWKKVDMFPIYMKVKKVDINLTCIQVSTDKVATLQFCNLFFKLPFYMKSSLWKGVLINRKYNSHFCFGFCLRTMTANNPLSKIQYKSHFVQPRCYGSNGNFFLLKSPHLINLSILFYYVGRIRGNLHVTEHLSLLHP